MIPQVRVTFNSGLPPGATFWTPRDEEVGDGGFGFFRDTWSVRDVGVTLAQAVIEEEAELLALADRHSDDEREFDTIASAIESGDAGALPARYAGPSGEALREGISDIPSTEGMEIGVAGLVYALASAGFRTAASCRGHPGGWARHPVVYFAADERRANALQPLVEDAACGFQLDPERPDLLVVASASVEDSARLARRVVEARSALVRHDPR